MVLRRNVLLYLWVERRPGWVVWTGTLQRCVVWQWWVQPTAQALNDANRFGGASMEILWHHGLAWVLCGGSVSWVQWGLLASVLPNCKSTTLGCCCDYCCCCCRIDNLFIHVSLMHAYTLILETCMHLIWKKRFLLIIGFNIFHGAIQKRQVLSLKLSPLVIKGQKHLGP